jgi:hypothetical protein
MNVGDRLMMEAANTSETFINFHQTTQRNNPEDSHLLEKNNSITVVCSSGQDRETESLLSGEI